MDFSQSGATSGINYVNSFRTYKEMLSKDPESSMYQRIFSEFNNSLFGTTPVLSNNFVADNGDYDSELERFKDEVESTSPTKVADKARANEFPPSLPVLPPQSDHHISISVTSNVLHTTAMSSQVSNIISSAIAPPQEPEAVIENPPPRQKARPAPKKKGGKSLKSIVVTPNADADAFSTPKNEVNQQAESTPTVEPPTRALRSRSSKA